MDAIQLLQELVRLPGPPGQEDAVREWVIAQVVALGLEPTTDAKGNVLVKVGRGEPKVAVTAHMDEIAMLVRRIDHDTLLTVAPMGGLHPWKLGEGPVSVLSDFGPVNGVFGFGSIHTADPSSAARRGELGPITWEMARVFIGEPRPGIRPGTRVVIHPSRRELLPMNPFIAGYFLDDRAELVSWLIALAELKGTDVDAVFIASVSEEVGGEGACYALHDLHPDVCIALELGPAVGDAPIILSDQPTVWATDSYATMAASDGKLLQELGKELGMRLQFQALTRGGSDASISASKGLCARPITLGIPMTNTHGFEVIHQGGMDELARLTSALVLRLAHNP